MTYPENLNKLISYIPAEVYAEHEKQITELADAIATDRARLKEAVLGSWVVPDLGGDDTPAYCKRCREYYGTPHKPDCIVRQLEEEGE